MSYQKKQSKKAENLSKLFNGNFKLKSYKLVVIYVMQAQVTDGLSGSNCR